MSIKAVCDYAQSAGVQGSEAIPRWVKAQESVRRNLAQLIGAGPNEIAFVGSTSEGISIVASGLDWKEGDNVVIPDVEFPSNVYPWLNLKRRGVKVRWWRDVNGRLSLDDLRILLDSRTRVVSVSAVQYGNGFRVDLSGLSGMLKKRTLCVDCIQQVGAIPLDAGPWGWIFARRAQWLLSWKDWFFFCDETLDRLHPATVDGMVVDALSFTASTYASDSMQPVLTRFAQQRAFTDWRLQISLRHWNCPHFENLLAADELQKGLPGAACILSWLGEHERSGILVFTTGKKDKEVYEHLRRNKIITSLRGGGIRLSPHFYNNEEDVRRFFEVLDKTSH
jgi:selenocysteine lyase/cysteine desulfurase